MCLLSRRFNVSSDNEFFEAIKQVPGMSFTVST